MLTQETRCRSAAGFQVLACLLMLAAGAVVAKPASGRLERDPRKPFHAILAAAAKGDAAAMAKGIEALGGLPAEIKGALGVDIESELSAAARGQDPAAALKAGYRLVYLDIKLTFLGCTEAPGLKERKRWVRAAYGDFSILGPTLRKSHFDQHRRIQKAFWKANSCLADEDRQALLSVFGTIESELSTVLGVEP